MGKVCSDSFMDAAHDWLQTNGTHMLVVGGSCFAASSATIASSALASATTASGDYAKANGDTSGRKVTIATHSACAIQQSGNAQHVCLIDASAETVYYQTTCTSQALTSGTVDVPAWDVEILDPA